MVEYMKDYSSNRMGWVDSTVLADEIDIPDTPVLTYTGDPGFAKNALRFQTSAFSSPGSSFSALKWRIAEVTDPGAPGFDATARRKYEISTTWESEDITVWDNAITIPDEDIDVGDTYRVRVRMKDDSGRWSHWSSPIQFEAGAVDHSLVADLRITEIMYHPADSSADEIAAGFRDAGLFEFIEVKNVGVSTLDLSGVRFANGLDFAFSGSAVTSLSAGDYVVVVKDLEAFEARYGTGLNVAGAYGVDSLDNRGERIRLEDGLGLTIQDFDYDNSWSELSDGMGFSLTVLDEGSSDLAGWGLRAAWRASSLVHGSPGAADEDLVPEPGSIVINEVLAHSHAAAPDWIELHNTTGGLIQIGGWFISDRSSDLMKYEIPAGTNIAANGYLVFYEDTQFGNAAEATSPFALSENGETVYLSSGSGGVVTGYQVEESFGASQTAVAFGRYYKASTDSFNFVAMATNTPGAANDVSLVGPIVISELMYHPQDAPAGNPDAEYIELYNMSASPVTLEDSLTGATWKITDGVDFSFPANTTMAAGTYLLLVKDAAAFAAEYPGVPGGVPVLQWTSGSLGNGGERVQLAMPGDVDALLVRQYIRVDRVNYLDSAPWPVSTDGAGDSLTRVDVSDYGNDVSNWSAATPSPGEE
jgi:hypothetical protein